MKVLEGYPKVLVELYHELGFSYDDIREMETDYLESEEQFKEWVQDCPFSFEK